MNVFSVKEKLHKALSTIRIRILLITVSLTILLSSIITLISYHLISNDLRENLLRTSEIRLSFVCSSINSNIEGVLNYIYSCKNSQQIRKFVQEQEVSGNYIRREAHDFVTDTYASNSALPAHLVRLVIIGKYRKDIIQLVEASYSTGKVSSDAILALPYFEQLHDDSGESLTGILPDPFYTAREIPMIPFVHPIQHPYKAEEIGYIYTEMSINTLTDPVYNYLSETEDQFYFKIGDQLYQYINDALVPCQGTIAETESVPYTPLHENTVIQRICFEESKESRLLISQPLAMDGWSVMTLVDEHELSQNILHSFLLIFLIIIITASMIGFILFNILSHMINVPVAKLQMRMKRIEEGDFSRDPSTEWEHELGDIGKTINNLSENVLLLMNQRIEDEKQKKDYEYKMLQSQINPHFMHNTLNSIKWMATIQNAPGIAEMTTSLARLFKNISNGSTSLIPIRQELALIQDYFTIQQYRYGGIITLSIQTDDEELLSCMILKFTLQPLIENAIFHGIEPKDTAGNILIHIFKDEEENIHIDVSDDGVGMEPEIAATLLEEHTPAASSFFKEIGIANVHKRLNYEFGANYGLSIHSVLGQGTTVTILLPFVKSENNDDKITDC